MASRADKTKLTPALIKALKPAGPGKRYQVYDSERSNLAVRVTDTGAKSFIIIGRMMGKHHAHTHVLGRCSDIELKDARAQVPEILGLLRQGKDPKRELKKATAETFEAAVVAYLMVKQRQLRPLVHYQTEGHLRRNFMGQRRQRSWDREQQVWTSEWIQAKDDHFRRVPVSLIKRRDLIRRLLEIAAADGDFVAKHALASVRGLFNWIFDTEQFGLTENPVTRLRTQTIGLNGSKETERSRVLNNHELRLVWQAALRLGQPQGDLVRVLMLTGQRKSDWASAEVKEIDWQEVVLTVPADRYKNKSDHEVPLGPKVREILEAAPRRGRFLFSTTGRHELRCIGWVKRKLDKLTTELNGGVPLPHWVIHDLRRTCRSRLSELGVDTTTAELVLGHAQPKLHRIYDRSSHRAQKRAALELWEQKLLEIVGEEPTMAPNVIQLPQLQRA
jgi:integrase